MIADGLSTAQLVKKQPDHQDWLQVAQRFVKGLHRLQQSKHNQTYDDSFKSAVMAQPMQNQ